jgi:hypothetical protein
LEEISCIWGGGGLPYYPEVGPGSDEDELEYNEKFWASIPKILPEAKEYAGQLEARFSQVSLRGRTVQCIIKLANIHLTPEQPEYKGGSWHVEGTFVSDSSDVSFKAHCEYVGMVNERIVASGIYVRSLLFPTCML